MMSASSTSSTSRTGLGAGSRQRGMTLTEIMIAVVIVSILAAVAIPAFTRYVKRSKTSEAQGNIAKIYQGQLSYYQGNLERGGTLFVNAAAVEEILKGFEAAAKKKKP